MDDELDQGIDYYGRKSGKFKLRGQRCKELGGLRKTATDCQVRSYPRALSDPHHRRRRRRVRSGSPSLFAFCRRSCPIISMDSFSWSAMDQLWIIFMQSTRKRRRN